MLKEASDDFDVTEMTVYWCEDRKWDKVHKKGFST